MSPEDIAALLQAEGSGNSTDYDESSQPPGARQRRTELLAPVLSVCQQAWFSGSEQIDYIAEKLGDGSRDVAWRGPFGDSGILEFFLGALAMDGLRQGLLVHSLRLVGNSCADTDENRSRVVQGNHMASIIRQLQNEMLIPFTVPVLYNILVDYEPAQVAASQGHLNHFLTTLLASPNITNYSAFVPYFCKTLCLLAAHESEASVANPLTLDIILTLATSAPYKDDLDDFMSLLSVAAAYLAGATFQTALVSGPSVHLFLNAFHHIHAAFDPQDVDDPDVSVELRQLRTALLTSLADVTGHDAFFAYRDFASPDVQTLWAWLHDPNPQLQTAACIALGNMSRSDDACIALVHTHAAHTPLANLLSDPAVADAQLLHSALSFLKNLAIPAQNKPLLGVFLEASCIPRIYGLDALQQVQFDAVSLTRMLLLNCPANVRRFCAPLSADPASPAHERTSVHSLASLFERSDADPTRLEAGRAVAALCRVFYSTPDASVLPAWGPEDSDEATRREMFFKKHDRLGEVMALLITQQKWPTVRSEAWFILALMSRQREGAGFCLTMQPHNVNHAIIEAVTGRREIPGQSADDGADGTMARQGMVAAQELGLEPQPAEAGQRAGMARVDRENALVFCTEVLRHWGESLPEMRRGMLQDLVKEGTELVVAERARQ